MPGGCTCGVTGGGSTFGTLDGFIPLWCGGLPRVPGFVDVRLRVTSSTLRAARKSRRETRGGLLGQGRWRKREGRSRPLARSHGTEQTTKARREQPHGNMASGGAAGAPRGPTCRARRSCAGRRDQSRSPRRATESCASSYSTGRPAPARCRMRWAARAARPLRALVGGAGPRSRGRWRAARPRRALRPWVPCARAARRPER